MRKSWWKITIGGAFLDQVTDNNLLFRFFNEIGAIEQLARGRLERVLPYDMTMSQFTVLHHLVKLSATQSPVTLARAMQVSKATMTNTVQKLQAKGLVSVASDPRDGRGKLVQLTQAGREARDRAIQRIEPEMQALAMTLGREPFALGLPYLEAVRRKLHADRSD